MSYTTGYKGRYGLWGASPSGFHSRQAPFLMPTKGKQETATLAQSTKVEKKDNHALKDKNVQDLKVKEVQPTVGDQVQDREMNASIRE